jgi:16S rRNA (uracil1498-N3)-methyltransferase
MANLYLDESLAGARVGDRVEITGAEAKHAAAVSRLRTGEVVQIGNGRGLVVTGPAEEATPTRVAVRVESVRTEPGPARRLVLAQALAKGDRDELAVQAATELGVDRVLPWAAERSIVRWQGEKRAKGRERWRGIVREASKQAMRAWLPEVGELSSTAELAALAPAADLVVLEPGASDRLADLGALRDARRDLVLVVGPEGGISPAELALFRSAGASLARLGSSVLRTSTAGPAALAIVASTIGRW